jgi:hypothetical protein
MCILKPKTGTLSGTVTDKLTGKPVAGVSVLINGLKMATSDSKGQYVIKGLKPGQDVVEFEKPGYINVID